jgi:Uma2 family endonuclease
VASASGNALHRDEASDTMATSILIEDQLEIPLLQDLGGFRRWALSERFPESGRIDYIAGQIEVDMSPEDLHTHGTPKVELVRVLANHVRRRDLGELYTDRARISCPAADLSVEPDIVFVSHEAFENGRVRLVAKSGGQADRYAEMEGAPDLIVEIISESSVRKDTERLPAAYWQAGVPEYWLVDARKEALVFRIQHRGRSEYEPVRIDDNGFQYSGVLECWYCLERTRNRYGRLQYALEEKPE